MNGLYLTVDGVVGTEPRRAIVNGQPLLSFRMVANERRYDNVTQSWIDLHSSWLSVSCFRAIARNAAASIKKGDRVIVHGRMRIKDYVSADGERRTSVDVEASSLGHDLRFGTSLFEPMRAAENVDDRLREHADVLLKELAELPEESVEDLITQRASLPGEPLPERGPESSPFDGDDDPEENDLVEDRAQSVRGAHD